MVLTGESTSFSKKSNYYRPLSTTHNRPGLLKWVLTYFPAFKKPCTNRVHAYQAMIFTRTKTMDSDVAVMLWAAHQRPGGTGSGLLQVKKKRTVRRDRVQRYFIYIWFHINLLNFRAFPTYSTPSRPNFLKYENNFYPIATPGLFSLLCRRCRVNNQEPTKILRIF